MADKIDQLKIGDTSYDIDLPPDATPIVASLQTNTIKVPTTSGGSTYGVGSSNQVIKSNGTTAYWGSDDNTFPVISAPSSTTLTDAQKTAIINGCVTDSGFTSLVNHSSHFTFFPGSLNPASTGNKHYGVFACFDNLYGYTISTSTNEIALDGLSLYTPTFRYTNSSNETVFLKSPAEYSSWPDGLHHYIATTDILAPSIAKGRSYKVGDVITYNGKFYRCITAHIQNSGSYVWSSNKWTEISSQSIFVNTYAEQTIEGIKHFKDISYHHAPGTGSSGTTVMCLSYNGLQGYGANGGGFVKLAWPQDVPASTGYTVTLPKRSGTVALLDSLTTTSSSGGGIPYIEPTSDSNGVLILTTKYMKLQ